MDCMSSFSTPSFHPFANAGYHSRILKETEKASPGYYSVYLYDHEVNVLAGNGLYVVFFYSFVPSVQLRERFAEADDEMQFVVVPVTPRTGLAVGISFEFGIADFGDAGIFHIEAIVPFGRDWITEICMAAMPSGTVSGI